MGLPCHGVMLCGCGIDGWQKWWWRWSLVFGFKGGGVVERKWS
ncbi:hypothetical protein RchiOBHm_Chr1g0352941 [Rosa chinensis]|uniref:Uncharacterized protein n=1 Tax=Rosa chinensis TaxID=74649 RepID=A0A2P6SGR4_ROSCH|nr:hypothetical protein RchiOBHm_Chr1g0352941 [Rosa chinensis]